MVGVIPGAGKYRPGIVMDKTDEPNRLPVAIVGKVYCKVDARNEPVNVGDLMTTSELEGYAMKASDRHLAFGAVIGKGLTAITRRYFCNSHSSQPSIDCAMPIHVKRDLKPLCGFGTQFSLKDIPNFASGSVLNRVGREVADANWSECYKDYNWTVLNAKRDISKTLGKKFNILSPTDEETFDDLWKIVSDSRDWAKAKEWPASNAIHLAIEAEGNFINKLASSIPSGHYASPDLALVFNLLKDIRLYGLICISSLRLRPVLTHSSRSLPSGSVRRRQLPKDWPRARNAGDVLGFEQTGEHPCDKLSRY